MGLTLFFPNRSFNYPLAWIYLSMFTISVLWITIYLLIFDKHLLKSRLAAGPVAETRLLQKVIQSLAGLSFIAVYILSAFDYKNQWSNIPLQYSYIANAICTLSFVFLFFVFKQNTFLSATIEVQEKQKVITSGLYGIVRHPMYSGAFVLLLFTPIALGSIYGLLPVFVLFAVIVLRVLDEEQTLKTNLIGYNEYCEKVKYRLIPYIF